MGGYAVSYHGYHRYTKDIAQANYRAANPGLIAGPMLENLSFELCRVGDLGAFPPEKLRIRQETLYFVST